MKKEMLPLEQNGAWDLTVLPPGKKAVGCQWVYTMKLNPNRSLACLKAHLIAKGYSQTYEMDYDTFSPVAE